MEAAPLRCFLEGDSPFVQIEVRTTIALSSILAAALQLGPAILAASLESAGAASFQDATSTVPALALPVSKRDVHTSAFDQQSRHSKQEHSPSDSLSDSRKTRMESALSPALVPTPAATVPPAEALAHGSWEVMGQGGSGKRLLRWTGGGSNGHYDGYECDSCHSCLQGPRWHCEETQEDYCSSCHNKTVAEPSTFATHGQRMSVNSTLAPLKAEREACDARGGAIVVGVVPPPSKVRAPPSVFQRAASTAPGETPLQFTKLSAGGGGAGAPSVAPCPGASAPRWAPGICGVPAPTPLSPAPFGGYVSNSASTMTAMPSTVPSQFMWPGAQPGASSGAPGRMVSPRLVPACPSPCSPAFGGIVPGQQQLSPRRLGPPFGQPLGVPVLSSAMFRTQSAPCCPPSIGGIVGGPYAGGHPCSGQPPFSQSGYSQPGLVSVGTRPARWLASPQDHANQGLVFCGSAYRAGSAPLQPTRLVSGPPCSSTATKPPFTSRRVQERKEKPLSAIGEPPGHEDSVQTKARSGSLFNIWSVAAAEPTEVHVEVISATPTASCVVEKSSHAPASSAAVAVLSPPPPAVEQLLYSLHGQSSPKSSVKGLGRVSVVRSSEPPAPPAAEATLGSPAFLRSASLPRASLLRSSSAGALVGTKTDGDPTLSQLREAHSSRSRMFAALDDELNRMADGWRDAHAAFARRADGLTVALSDQRRQRENRLGDIRHFRRECQDRHDQLVSPRELSREFTLEVVANGGANEKLVSDRCIGELGAPEDSADFDDDNIAKEDGCAERIARVRASRIGSEVAGGLTSAYLRAQAATAQVHRDDVMLVAEPSVAVLPKSTSGARVMSRGAAERKKGPAALLRGLKNGKVASLVDGIEQDSSAR